MLRNTLLSLAAVACTQVPPAEPEKAPAAVAVEPAAKAAVQVAITYCIP